MKIIKIIDERYYPEPYERALIESQKVIKLKDIARELKMHPVHFWRKRTRFDYPNNAFSRMEVEKMQVLTGIKFNLH